MELHSNFCGSISKNVWQLFDTSALDGVKEVTHHDLVHILENLDQDLAKGALGGPKFEEFFFANCKDEKIAEAVKKVLA